MFGRFPAALLLGVSRRCRLFVFGALAVFWVGFWSWSEGGALVGMILRPFEMLGARVPGMVVSENIGILNLLLLPQMLLLLSLSVWSARRAGADNRLLWLAAYFVLSNQVRYGGIIAPLLALHVLPAVAAMAWRWPTFARSSAVALASVWLSPR